MSRQIPPAGGPNVAAASKGRTSCITSGLALATAAPTCRSRFSIGCAASQLTSEERIMMALSRQFIFVHVPKTGGNSIQNVLKAYSEDEIVCTEPYQDGVERFELKNPTW